MNSLHASAGRTSVVLVVDPSPESRFTMRYLLGGRFRVLEASDLRGAREWLECGREIDAIVVQRELPDGDGSQLVDAFPAGWLPGALRAVVVDRADDLRTVAVQLTRWLSRDSAAGARRADRPTAHHAGAETGT